MLMPNFRRIALSVGEDLQFAKPMQFFVFPNEEEFTETYGRESYVPRVDFDRYFLVVVHQGQCPTGGYSITIENVEKRQGQLVVTVRMREPQPDEAVTLVGTYPQDAVLIPKRIVGRKPGRADFSFIDQRGNCLARRSVSSH